MARHKLESLRWGDTIAVFAPHGTLTAPAAQWEGLLPLFVPRVRNLIRQHLEAAKLDARLYSIEQPQQPLELHRG